MKTRRREVFLASKTHDRTRDDSLRLLDESLQLLQTDHLDLWQLHNVQRMEQLDQVFGKDGAIEALQRARSEKLVRFVGITSHFDPAVLLEGIRRYDFDTILMALNPADRHFLPFQEQLLPEANRRRMGVIAMKIPARGRIFRAGGITSIREPLTYVLSLPVSTVIIGCDNVQQLEENVAIATSFQQLGSAELARIEALTAGYAGEAAFFKRTGAGFGLPAADDQE
jgi:predicted aldo/keto reductase-like oxidoreductase